MNLYSMRKVDSIEFPRIDFLGIPLDLCDASQTVSICERFISQGGLHEIIAVNANKVVLYHQNPDLAKVMDRSDLNYIDGTSITFAGYLFNLRLPKKIPGVWLMGEMLNVAEKKGYRPYFFGARDWVLEKAICYFRTKYPGLQIAGYRHGYFALEDEPGIVEAIADSRADMLFVGFGSPQKELWLSKFKNSLNVPLCMGVGGSFDVAAGLYSRSPNWMADCGLEWAYRVMQEPRRMWKRYLTTNTRFLFYLIRFRLKSN